MARMPHDRGPSSLPGSTGRSSTPPPAGRSRLRLGRTASRHWLCRCSIGFALLLAGPAAADSIFGRWVVEDGKAVIELAPCGDAACGQLVWLQSPWDANGAPKRDDKNPDPQLRDRPLCGLQLVSGLERAGDGNWEDGKIYSTRDGRSYGIEVWLDGQDRLAVRGYLGLSLFGKTQTWTRDSMRRANCTAMTRPGTDR